MRYLVDFHVHEGAHTGPLMDKVGDDEISGDIASAKRHFSHLTAMTGDSAPIADGGSYADLYDGDGWDGVCYGEPVLRLTWNKNRSIHTESF